MFAPGPGKGVPALPEKWHAVALLTPFGLSQLVIADIVYDWSVQAMRVTAYGLEQGYADLLYTPAGVTLLESQPGQYPTACYGPVSSHVQVPAPDFLTGKVDSQGVQSILEVSCEWWYGKTPCTNGWQDPSHKQPVEVLNWFWFREDNQLPWRMFFVTEDNQYNIPVIGDYAMANFPTFEVLTETNLPQIIQTCTQSNPSILSETRFAGWDHIDRLMRANPVSPSDMTQEQVQACIQELIPGLYFPTEPVDPPVWNNRQFLTSISTQTIHLPPLPTQVYYDWEKEHMLTRFFLPDNAGTDDAILTPGQTVMVQRTPDGHHKCLKKLPVGLPYPDWVQRDGGVCKGILVNNPQLSPNRVTHIFGMHSVPPRVFWIWYTPTNQPILFVEVPQLCDVMLILTDYDYYWPNPGVSFDPSLFEIPQDCL